MNVLELSEQEIVRRQSLQQLRAMGIDPYPAAEYPTNAFSTDIKADFNENDKREVCIADRISLIRLYPALLNTGTQASGTPMAAHSSTELLGIFFSGRICGKNKTSCI